MSDCYTYSKNAGGRLAKTADYRYTQRDGSCQASRKPDAMISARIGGNVPVARSESANIAAIADGGIFKDPTCTGRPNHAVTAVGYTPSYVLVKNSWGNTWGDQGFVKFTRNYHNCDLWNYSSYPKLTATGKADNGNDAATDYNADDDSGPAPEPDCENSYDGTCYESWCKYDWIKEDYCEKTCNNCGGSDACPSGTCYESWCKYDWIK